ncbi:hypothetical protein F5Y18DRAFT_40450 [Xylariaceae sp. FL1019]|nr:hypothetical protein F5Y18DRAFT_40450 [Xylariaceae sp. FL1019]
MPAVHFDLEDAREASCLGLLCHPVEVGDFPDDAATFSTWPIFGPLIFENESSDARDHCANERTFLSYARLSVYMSIVSIAIALSFHLRSAPTALEKRMAMPLGLVFVLLSAACLAAGLGNYIKTMNKYGRKTAIVQSGWRTQSIMSLIAISITSTCVILLVIEKMQFR